jgi:hypothetical protein
MAVRLKITITSSIWQWDWKLQSLALYGSETENIQSLDLYGSETENIQSLALYGSETENIQSLALYGSETENKNYIFRRTASGSEKKRNH